MFKIIILLLLSQIYLFSQTTSSKGVLEKCIKHHDPKNNWQKYVGSFDMSIIREGQNDRNFNIQFNNKKGEWYYHYVDGKDQIKYGLKNGNKILLVNENISTSLGKYNLDEDRIQYMYEVYHYLFGIPQKLNKDIKYMEPVAKDTVFGNSKVWMINFDYNDPKKDNWKFFINKTNFQLEGYQFFKKSANEDGEFIFLEDWISIKGVLFPKKKIWYWNNTRKLFRTDIIRSFK